MEPNEKFTRIALQARTQRSGRCGGQLRGQRLQFRLQLERVDTHQSGGSERKRVIDEQQIVANEGTQPRQHGTQVGE